MGKSKSKDAHQQTRGQQGAESLKSMTGYGSAVVTSDSVHLEIETRSVNSRFLDLVIRMPKVYSKCEAGLRDVISSLLHRGRVEVYVSRTPVREDACGIEINSALLNAYVAAYDQVYQGFSLSSDDIKRDYLRDILNRGDVLSQEQGTELAAEEEELLTQGVTQAVQALIDSRSIEGVKIAEDLSIRLHNLSVLRGKVEEHCEQSPVQLKQKLDERLKRLGAEISADEDRVVMEAAIVADRADVTEELVRLASHIDEFANILKAPPNGRKLEFMLQEIAREFNTVSSKTVSADVPRLVVEAKSEIEKIKEQIQNVE